MANQDRSKSVPEPEVIPAMPATASWNPALRHEKEGVHATGRMASTKLDANFPPKEDGEGDNEDDEDDEDDDEEDDEEEEEEEDDEEDEDEEDEDEEDDEADNREKQASTGAAQPLHVKPQAIAQAKDHREDEDIEEESEEESADDDQVKPPQRQAENYEHQGDATALEDALIEGAELPLVQDTEAGVDEWGDSDTNFDIGGQAANDRADVPALETTGTNVGDNIIGKTTIGGNSGEDAGWGISEEPDDFFGNDLNQTVGPAPPAAEPVGAHVVNSGAKSTAQSDWNVDLDLDDDFLPNTENAPDFQLSGDEGFLEDEPPIPAQSIQTAPSSASRYAPQGPSGGVAATPGTNTYSPKASQFTGSSQNAQQRSSIVPGYNGFGQNNSYQQQQTARPAMPSSAQSFADKSKGGYASPYDMPDDIVTTRKRAAPRPTVSAAKSTPPPPRTSSISASTGPPRAIPTPDALGVTTTSQHPGYSNQSQIAGLPPSVPSAVPSKPPMSTTTSSNSFFAELPMTSKPRQSATYMPQQNVHSFSPPQPDSAQFPPKGRTSSWSSLRNEVMPDTDAAPPSLRHPEQLPMFPTQPSVPSRTNSLPISPSAPPSNRYSPAPPSGPSVNARYSPAPPNAPIANAGHSSAPPSGLNGQAHARYPSEPPNPLHRTSSQPSAPSISSPLASHSVLQSLEHSRPATEADGQQYQGHHATQSADGMPRAPFRSPLEGVNETEEPVAAWNSRPPTAGRSETPPLHSTVSSTVGSPRKMAGRASPYHPSNTVPPPRSYSQSPASSMRHSVQSLPSSEHATYARGSISGSTLYGTQSSASGTVNHIPHRRQPSLNYEALVPEDERAADPLQRWKGHPVFTWGIGGTIVTSFSKQIPRYGTGTSGLVVKCSPGEIKVHNVREVFALSEDIAKFPGPLKSKGKKKDVSAWLSRKIELLEMQLLEPSLENSLSQDELQRLEEKILLWKLVQVLLDNDGHVEGPVAEAAIKKVLSPHDSAQADPDASFSTAADLVRRSRSNTSNAQAEPIDVRAVENLQSMLAKGDREKAVWHAVDHRLWGHAMLLSSTLNRDVWKQVVQEFVRKEVKNIGRNNQALAVLYEIFAGNHVDCVDELVPASARAGFQMVSADGVGATQNALQGLGKWRETVALILNNRSEGDSSALLSLGRLLAQYGRVEAAHVCFIFAHAVVNVSGVDDVQADLVLLGADHGKYPSELGIDLDTVLLTEVYEFALSLSTPGGSHIIPHLQNYKLEHAYHLAEYGYRADAQAYCDAIATAMKATTRISPYYNASFIARLDDLSKRLSQSPKDGTSSWISKPSMDKVGSSLLSKLNNFIVGEEEGSASNQSGGAEASPFANIAGDNPAITPSQSSTDLYGAYPGYGVPTQPLTPGNSKYAPSNMYAPRTSSEQQRTRYEPQGQPFMEHADASTSQHQLSPPGQRTQAKAHSYSPLRPESIASQPPNGSAHLAAFPFNEPASTSTFSDYNPSQASFGEKLPSADNQQASNGYEPSSSSSYRPYNPDEKEEEEEEEEQPRKKKSFMDDDDDDDLMGRAANLKPSGKSDADKKADEAFRKAAEADAQREKDAAAGKKAGWFGGWFKKDAAAGPGPIKAKLGDENSFVYDPELKKWVNKKAGAPDVPRPSATPPPPRGGPPGARSASSSATPMGPPMGALKPPTSMARSSSMPPPMGIPGSRSSTPGLPSDNEAGPRPPVLTRPSFGAASLPPSRPGTGMSTASSIDDLLGAPQARKGASSKKKKGGRYVDVMAQGG